MIHWSLVREFVKVRSRKRKPSLPRLSSSAIVNTDLEPRGSVLAGGELWPAETLHGNSIQRRATVTVVGFKNHRLVVEERS
ncbi:MAG TPA: NfeD family protein [Pyrinomonadaceae bacterium]|nr:NfeD family protein [Pyrinomonadaceae bacterium]